MMYEEWEGINHSYWLADYAVIAPRSHACDLGRQRRVEVETIEKEEQPPCF